MGMDEKQNQLSGYIDQLNNGKKPVEHETKIDDSDYERLMETVRRVRLLREVEYPKEDYSARLADAVKERIVGIAPEKGMEHKKREGTLIRRIVFFTTTAIAAAAIIILVPRILLPNEKVGIVYAMEKAYEEMEAYHGTITVTESNELGDTMTQAVREVWADQEGNYYIKELEGTAKGIITINNGEMKWQLRPGEKASYLFATFPDPYRFTFELAEEIDDLKTARKVEEIGDEVIAGRRTTILRVTPEGGDPYRLWVDQETSIPLQRESAMQNAIRYLVTYTAIEFVREIPNELLQYQLPEGFDEVDSDADQVVNTLEEVEGMIGFWPNVIDHIPVGYSLAKVAIRKEQNKVRFYYMSEEDAATVRIEQGKVSGERKADSMAILGKVNGHKAEIIVNAETNSVRWQEDGIEYNVVGNLALNELMPFLQELSQETVELPKGLLEGKEPEVKVEVDLVVVESEQKSVDAGHSPWKLDPVFVSQVFASLLLSPEGIIGEYPISYENIEMIENDGSRAVARIKSDNSIAEYIYLERLVRQDETGIWTVVGYDKAE
jgi:outer membrane lipoprotein-sorting protein